MAEAKKRAKELQLRAAELKNELKAAQAAGESTKVDNLVKQIEKDTADSLELLELALKMTDGQTSPDDLSNIRYLQSAC